MITVIALLRLVPYLFAAINAWTKGYRWLTMATLLVSVMAIVNFTYDLPQEWRGVISSLFALLLMFHSLELKPKHPKGGDQ